jgi:hypothetical protein
MTSVRRATFLALVVLMAAWPAKAADWITLRTEHFTVMRLSGAVVEAGTQAVPGTAVAVELLPEGYVP